MYQPIRILSVFAYGVAACLLLATSTSAIEPALDFIQGLHKRGYGEMAVEYLEQLKARGPLPADVADTYDLLMSESVRKSIKEAFNEQEREQRTAKAEELLQKFLKEHPNHGQALDAAGDVTMNKVLDLQRQAKAAKELEEKTKLLTASRKVLEEARPQFVKSVEQHLKVLSDLQEAQASGAAAPKRGPATSRQKAADEALQDAQLDWLDARFRLAMVDYYLAQTYPRPTDAGYAERLAKADVAEKASLAEQEVARKKVLSTASKSFDEIFQENRLNSLVGLYAHMWQGKCVEERGEKDAKGVSKDDLLALDIYDEVLALLGDDAKEAKDRNKDLDNVFAQVETFRLEIVKRRDGMKEYATQSEDWLSQPFNKNLKYTDGYQGMVVDLAKYNLEQAATATGALKGQILKKTLTMLNDSAKVKGLHQQEIILLLKTLRKEVGGADATEAKNFDEAIALGNDALRGDAFEEAAGLFEKAIAFAKVAKDKKGLDAAKAAVDQTRYKWAVSLHQEGKLNEAFAKAKDVMDNVESPLAPSAWSLCVTIRLGQYAAAPPPDRAAAMEELTKVAAPGLERWGDKAEADDARISLGQANLVRGEYPAAIAVFESVNPRSTRYGIALYLAGQTHWRLYTAEKAKAEGTRDEDVLKKERDKAEEQVAAGLEGQKRNLKKDATAPRQLNDNQLLLGEIYVDSGQFAKASALLQPLVDTIKEEKPQNLDNTMLKTIVATVRAYSEEGQMAKAGEVAMLVTELGPDAPIVNSVLNSFTKRFSDEYKKRDAEFIEAQGANDLARKDKALADRDAVKGVLTKLLENLAPRKSNPPTALIFVADSCAQMGLTDLATGLYERVLEAAKAGPSSGVNPKSLTRIRSELVGLLRQKGEFQKGVTEVDKLIETNPNALEPLMAKGRILQSWAEKEPEKFGEAVAHWTLVRSRLSRMAKKPPEYYEVIYNAAVCLNTEYEKSQIEEKAKQAEQLLNATLVLSPQLNGPDAVARYNSLLAKIRLRGGKPGAAANKPAAPSPVAAAGSGK